jgi:hypothetical protein
MTQTRFNTLCQEYYIDPMIALENDNVVEALRNKDDSEVERILSDEF